MGEISSFFFSGAHVGDKEWGPKSFDTTDQQSQSTKSNGVETVLAVRRPQIRCFYLGLGNERRSWMHIVTSWCEGVRNGASLVLVSHTHTQAHARTRAGHKSPPPQSLTGGRFLRVKKVLDARIDRLTAEYSIFEFSGRFLLTPKHTRQQPIAKSSRAPTHSLLLCRLFSQRPLVPHVCMRTSVWVCVCTHMCV